MSYPDNKETWNRVILDDLIPPEHKNEISDFLERFQDTIGLNIKSTFSNLADRLDDIESKLNGNGTIWHNVNIFDGTAPTEWTPIDISTHIGNNIQKVVLLAINNTVPGPIQIYLKPGGYDVVMDFQPNLDLVHLATPGWKYTIIYTNNVGIIEHNWTQPNAGSKIDLIASW